MKRVFKIVLNDSGSRYATEIMNKLEQQYGAKEVEPSEDCISRQAMLSLQTEYAEEMSATTFWKMRDDIRCLPSVTPQRPKGKWIDCKCSKCNYEVMEWNKTNFCPNCGAEMSGGREDETSN